MTSITPKGKKIAYLHLAANTPGHPDQAEAKARLAKLAGVTREPVAENQTFSLELAQQLIDSDSKFPVSFDLAWQWIGYSTKGNGKKALLNAGFIENEDLVLDLIQLDKPTTVGIAGIQGGDVNENIFLTVECFKMWGMMAKTAQGRKVREYFLECERIAKQPIAQNEPEPTPPPTPQLPPADIRVTNLTNALDRLGINLQNPRLKQGLQDLTLDILGIGQPALKSENNEIWCGVVERAEQMGYPASVATKHNITLGQAIAKFGLKSRKEDRLCNGTQRPINIYLVCDELDEAIFSYFSRLKIFP